MADKISENKTFLPSVVAAVRVAAMTLFICCVCYTLIVLGVAQLFNNHTANGSLIVADNGSVLGSEVIAQAFTSPKYFHPRPSAGGYNGMASGGSNLSPTSEKVKERIETILTENAVTAVLPIPMDAITASGSGLDPHISLQSALFQIRRVAEARNMDEEALVTLLNDHVEEATLRTGGEPLINVLKINLLLDKTQKSAE